MRLMRGGERDRGRYQHPGLCAPRGLALAPGGLLMAEQGFEVTPGVHDVHNADARFHDAVENEVLSHREAAIATPQFVTAASGPGIVSQ